MGINALEGSGRQVPRNIQCLIFVFLLSCVTNAAALTFNEAVPDELPAFAYRWLADINATEAVVPGRQVGDRKIVWGFPAGYRLVVGMGGRVEADRPPHIFFEQERIPHVAVRIERQF